MTAVIAVVVCLPLAGGLAALSGAAARRAGAVTAAGATASLAGSIFITVRADVHGGVQALGGFVYVDALGSFFAATVALVVVLAAVGSMAYVAEEETRGTLSSFQVRLYFAFFSVFASGMLASFYVGNLGLLWVLIETSTLASVALVGLEAKPASLEAAWKYVIISSFGVTIALVATLFLFYAGTGLHLGSDQRLTWPYLFVHAAGLQPTSLRLAFLLAVVGYGTKVGLAPMHTWLPDAHSEAPSPASAMLSAGLLNTGMYAVIRFRAIAQRGLGAAFPDHTLLVFGFLSLFIAVLFMIRAGNYKRLLAYSSIEHMGIIAVALGFGGILGVYGALLQTLTHAVAKSVLFLCSGHFVLGYRSRQAADVRGVLGVLPFAGGVFLLGALAVAGSPPFGVFLSELTIVRAGFAGTPPEVVGLLLLLLAVGFFGIVGTVLHMVGGSAPLPDPPYAQAAGRVAAGAPLVAGLAVLVLLGVWIPGVLNGSILHAVKAIT